MSLPKGFKRLEWIRFTGPQYINTNFIPDSNSAMEIEFDNTGATEGCIIGQDNGWLSKGFAIFYQTTEYGSKSNNYTDRFGHYTMKLDKNQRYVNGELEYTYDAQTFAGAYPLWIGALNRSGSAADVSDALKVYFCKIWNNGTLVRDYIPCQNASGAVGLWDAVNDEFYRNAGTGEFIAGPEAATTPKAPANFRVESETDTLVTLAWDPGEDAMGYRLYRQGQLLADIAETSVSVEAEPFAGAVFTVTAYNENGEGPGSTLTYYNIPDNPLLYLITDRTQKDVAERNPKGYYAASDLNRVGYAIDYLATIIRGYGYTLEVHTKTDWTDEDWKLTGEMVQYLQSLNNLKSVFSTLVELPETMEKINYADANNIEQLLLTIDETVVRVVAGFTRANAFGLRSGAKGLPVSQSDRGRNWGQLDAMETTWANWQLATWYLLLYGNLKAEGVVE